MPDDRDSILDVLKGVEAAFSELDIPRWLSHFHSVYVLMAPQGVVAPASGAEAAALVRPLIEGLRDRGYAKSDLNRTSIRLLSAKTALAAVGWIRRNRDGEEIERFAATYAFFKGVGGWKIVLVTTHPEETFLHLE